MLSKETLNGNFIFPNLKLFGTLIVIAFVGLTFFIEQETDCDRKLFKVKHIGKETPSPEGCTLKMYSKKSTSDCLSVLYERRKRRKLNVSFVGGDEIQRFYLAFDKQVFYGVDDDLRMELKNNNDSLKEEPRRDLPLEATFINHSKRGTPLKKLFNEWNTHKSFPDLVIVGFSPTDLDSDGTVNRLVNEVKQMAFELDVLAEHSTVLWLVPSQGQPSLPPLQHVLRSTHVIKWEPSPLRQYFYDIEHSNRYEFQFEVQSLLNHFCNAFETESSTLCCSPHDRSLFYWKILLFIIVLSALLSFFAICINNYWKTTLELVSENAYKATSSISKRFSNDKKLKEDTIVLPVTEKSGHSGDKHGFSFTTFLVKCVFIFSYFFVCDRTSLFEKREKHFSLEAFFAPVVLSFLFGFALFIRKSGNSKPLNREITDEWKGWMQIVILIYHFTGSSTQLHIYMHIRIFVSSYLFMTGFGNFTYYWQGGPLSLRRYCQVMLRMNFLTLILCIVMGRMYQFYYFVPLVSFWYTILFLLLLLPPKLSVKTEDNKQTHSECDYVIAAIKLVALFALVTALSFSKNMFDSIFLLSGVNKLFILPFNSDYEWWFRWNLDKYSIIYGALFALLYKRITENSEDAKNGRSNLKWRPSEILISFLAIGMMLCYSLLFFGCSTKQTCNTVHPFVVALPILGYILLRNMNEVMRSYHSFLMVGVGKISLELFICQYHIWLASDTRGTLVLLLWVHPVVNFVVVSFLFVCVAKELNTITGELVTFMLPKDNVRICINLLLFFVSLYTLSILL